MPNINTPTGTPFSFRIDHVNSSIIITSQNNHEHRYQLRSLNDLYNWLLNDRNEEWVLLGTKGEEESPRSDTAEAWARSENNPVQGFYGITTGRRGRFATYIPSILESLGVVEVEHKKRNNRVRALRTKNKNSNTLNRAISNSC
jgi:hypothetical protein